MHFAHVLASTMGLVLMVSHLATAGESVADLQKAAKEALDKGKVDDALKLAGQAVALDPKNPQPHVFRAALCEVADRHADALADLTKAIDLDPKLADAYDRRGSVHFKLARFKESLADFDKFLDLRPAERDGHWRRGITCYYAGRFEEGRKQFEGYEKVDTNDVENAVWHFLCVARADGPAKAREKLLKIGNDRRVPMMQVYELFAGRLKPEEVLTAAKAGKPSPEQLTSRLFYAHLYLGLYAEVTGDGKSAREHLKAAEAQRINHYMWDVARVHAKLLSDPPSK